MARTLNMGTPLGGTSRTILLSKKRWSPRRDSNPHPQALNLVRLPVAPRGDWSARVDSNHHPQCLKLVRLPLRHERNPLPQSARKR